jgi:hypothetical protein
VEVRAVKGSKCFLTCIAIAGRISLNPRRPRLRLSAPHDRDRSVPVYSLRLIAAIQIIDWTRGWHVL